MYAKEWSFENITNKLFLYKTYIFDKYMYKENLALSNLQYAIKPNQTKSYIFN